MRRAGKLSLLIFLIGLSFFSTGCKSDQPNNEQPLSSLQDSTFVDEEEEIKKELTGDDIRLEKDIRYDKYLLDDEYPYEDTTRHFQWDKIKEQIVVIENAMAEGGNWGVLSN